MYKEAFPDNPAFLQTGKKQKKKVVQPKEEPAQQIAQVVEAPIIDTSKIVEEALKVVADAIIMGTLQSINEPLPNVNDKQADCINFLYKSFDNLAANSDNFVWQSARDEFVENFSRLVNRSHNQLGVNTN